MGKTRKFTVPQELVCDFAATIEQFELANRIVGSEDDTIIVEVDYNRDEREAIFEIMELLDEEI